MCIPTDVLKKIDLFSSLGEREASLITSRLVPVQVKAGMPVVKEGEVGSSLYIIAAGRLEVRRAGTQS